MGHLLSLTSLTITELAALRLDGELSPNNAFWEEPDDWRTRSSSVLDQELHPLVLTGLSAVWSFDLVPEPQQHTASTITIHRIREPKNPVLKIEQRNLAATELWTHQNVGVTSPLRTTTDLLRKQNYEDENTSRAVKSMMRTFDITYVEIRTSLNSMLFFPYVRPALKRLDELKV